MSDYPFGQFGPEHLEKVKEGIKCYNSQEYWLCHEALEDVWLEDRNDPARNVYWAIIQVASALYHYENENIIGARGLLKKSKQKFQRCVDQNIETDIVFKYLSWKELKSLVYAVPDEPVLSDFDELYKFRFKDYPCN